MKIVEGVVSEVLGRELVEIRNVCVNGQQEPGSFSLNLSLSDPKPFNFNALSLLGLEIRCRCYDYPSPPFFAMRYEIIGGSI